jgi:hypothetical protein
VGDRLTTAQSSSIIFNGVKKKTENPIISVLCAAAFVPQFQQQQQQQQQQHEQASPINKHQTTLSHQIQILANG